jgi:ParB-like chromosome segregation protein Spo0J
VKTVTTKRVPIDDLVPAPVNANKMDAETYQRLVAAMKTLGPNLQPVLVVPLGSTKYHIVDGHHRVEAAREAGYADILVAIADLDDAERALLGLSMNRMRGEVDLHVASEILTELVDDGMDAALLALAGFGDQELTALLASQTETEIPPADVDSDFDEPARVETPFLLEVTFKTRDDLKRVKRALKRAAGKGSDDLGAGLLRLVSGS